ncbi:RecF/RecN/SMC, N-terminal [Paracoccaceae bacterium]
MIDDPEVPLTVEPVVPAPAPEPAEVIRPPKIKTLTLCDFRAFAGPAPIEIDLNGRNLLVFGENGAGKSSIFHALDGFFSVPSPAEDAASRRKKLANFANRFTEKARCRVRTPNWEYDGKTYAVDDVVEVLVFKVQKALDDNDILFVDGDLTASVQVTYVDRPDAITWNHTRHPIDTGVGAEQSVVNGAYRKAVLDYRALLETNFRHGDGPINLFDVCVRLLLPDFEVVYSAKRERICDLWSRLQQLIDLEARDRKRLSGSEKTEVQSLLPIINNGLTDALLRVQPLIGPILEKLGWKDIEVVRFSVPGLTYEDKPAIPVAQRLQNKRVDLELKFRGQKIDRPQSFLNEARLSALALAMYFAGRKVCAETLQADTPNLMVLDDVLIGLDQSNRLPVLDLLADDFRDWQIVLLTHDRVWFEMARAYYRRHKADKFWCFAKVHSNDDPTRAPVVTAVDSSAATEALKDAKQFLQQGHVNAAGNYARIATELALREFCEIKKVKVPYNQLPDKTPASTLLAAAKSFSAQNDQIYDTPLATIEMYSNILFNQLSHGGIPSVTQHEVQGALAAVGTLLFSLKVVPSNVKQET